MTGDEPLSKQQILDLLCAFIREKTLLECEEKILNLEEENKNLKEEIEDLKKFIV